MKPAQNQLRPPDGHHEPMVSAGPEGSGLVTVACYTFPHYHRSTLNDRLFAQRWTEYEIMRGGRPWFPGHHQPRTPLLGELDEADPATWRVYGPLARGSGIDQMIFDWYWYDGGPVLHEALEHGFLPTQAETGLGFAVMWTNHPWFGWFPTFGTAPSSHDQASFGTGGLGSRDVLSPGPETPEEIWRGLSYIAARYFHLPGYWHIDGEPVLVIWDMLNLVTALGETGAENLLSELRSFVRRLGHPGIHIHTPIYKVEQFSVALRFSGLGISSYGMYNAVYWAASERSDEEELIDYGMAAADVVTNVWPRLEGAADIPFWPSISPGWDSSPRSLEPRRGMTPRRSTWPAAPIVVDETPAAFGALARAGLQYAGRVGSGSRVMTIGCWNEWTEGHYLLPDTRLGYGMTRALGQAVAASRQTPSSERSRK